MFYPVKIIISVHLKEIGSFKISQNCTCWPIHAGCQGPESYDIQLRVQSYRIGREARDVLEGSRRVQRVSSLCRAFRGKAEKARQAGGRRDMKGRESIKLLMELTSIRELENSRMFWNVREESKGPLEVDRGKTGKAEKAMKTEMAGKYI